MDDLDILDLACEKSETNSPGLNISVVLRNGLNLPTLTEIQDACKPGCQWGINTTWRDVGQFRLSALPIDRKDAVYLREM